MKTIYFIERLIIDKTGVNDPIHVSEWAFSSIEKAKEGLAKIKDGINEGLEQFAYMGYSRADWVSKKKIDAYKKENGKVTQHIYFSIEEIDLDMFS